MPGRADVLGALSIGPTGTAYWPTRLGAQALGAGPPRCGHRKAAAGDTLAVGQAHTGDAAVVGLHDLLHRGVDDADVACGEACAGVRIQLGAAGEVDEVVPGRGSRRAQP